MMCVLYDVCVTVQLGMEVDAAAGLTPWTYLAKSVDELDTPIHIALVGKYVRACCCDLNDSLMPT